MSKGIAMVVIIVGLAGCREEAPAGLHTINVRGSETMKAVVRRLAFEYGKELRGADIEVNGGGSEAGFAALQSAKTDIAFSTTRPSPQQRAAIESARRSRLVEGVAAYEAIAFFTHLENPVSELTSQQVRDIYTGRLTEWPSLRQPITVFVRDDEKDVYDVHDFLTAAVLKTNSVVASDRRRETSGVANAVSLDPLAIGYGRPSRIDVRQVRILAIRNGDGSAVAPSAVNIRNGTYPFTRTVYFYWLESAPQEVTAFARWCSSPEGQKVIERFGLTAIR